MLVSFAVGEPAAVDYFVLVSFAVGEPAAVDYFVLVSFAVVFVVFVIFVNVIAAEMRHERCYFYR